VTRGTSSLTPPFFADEIALMVENTQTNLYIRSFSSTLDVLRCLEDIFSATTSCTQDVLSRKAALQTGFLSTRICVLGIETRGRSIRNSSLQSSTQRSNVLTFRSASHQTHQSYLYIIHYLVMGVLLILPSISSTLKLLTPILRTRSRHSQIPFAFCLIHYLTIAQSAQSSLQMPSNSSFPQLHKLLLC
jgi:hypothetical protein